MLVSGMERSMNQDPCIQLDVVWTGTYGTMTVITVFSLSNRTLDAKKVSLRKAGKGQKANAAQAVTEREKF